jgi:hypothetical protein
MFEKTASNIQEWEAFMKKNKDALKNKLRTSLAEIKKIMQKCNIHDIGIYFPTERILSPSFEDFLIIYFVENDQDLVHEALTQTFESCMFVILSDQFHYWIGSEHDLVRQSDRIFTQHTTHTKETFPNILKNIKMLQDFIK